MLHVVVKGTTQLIGVEKIKKCVYDAVYEILSCNIMPHILDTTTLQAVVYEKGNIVFITTRTINLCCCYKCCC